MRKLSIPVPLVAALCAIGGFFLRRHESAVVYDASGFPIRGAAATVSLAALSVAVLLAAAAAGILISRRLAPREEYGRAFGRGLAAMGLEVVLGLLLIYGAVLYLQGGSGGVRLVFAALQALTGVSLMVLARGAYTAKEGGLLLFSAIPPVFLCLLLILIYRANSANPILISYCYKILAAASAALCTYYEAGFIYGKPQGSKMIFSLIISVYFCGVTLADTAAAPAEAALFGALGAVFLLKLCLFLGGLAPKEGPRAGA